MPRKRVHLGQVTSLLLPWQPLSGYYQRGLPFSHTPPVENRVTESGQRSQKSREVDWNSPIYSPRPPPRRAPDESPAGRGHRHTCDALIMSLSVLIQQRVCMNLHPIIWAALTGYLEEAEMLFIFPHSYQLTAFEISCFLTWFPNLLACSTVQMAVNVDRTM